MNTDIIYAIILTAFATAIAKETVSGILKLTGKAGGKVFGKVRGIKSSTLLLAGVVLVMVYAISQVVLVLFALTDKSPATKRDAAYMAISVFNAIVLSQWAGHMSTKYWAAKEREKASKLELGKDQNPAADY